MRFSITALLIAACATLTAAVPTPVESVDKCPKDFVCHFGRCFNFNCDANSCVGLSDPVKRCKSLD